MTTTYSKYWIRSHRADPESRVIADRHYNRQKIGAPQFVPPGRCLVFRGDTALWVTSWPFAQFVKHAWAGAWVNSLFRREAGPAASEMIRAAVACTLFYWPEPPELGLITFVDPRKVKPTRRRGKEIFGYCYRKAGFDEVGRTKGGLLAFQLTPSAMPPPQAPLGELPV